MWVSRMASRSAMPTPCSSSRARNPSSADAGPGSTMAAPPSVSMRNAPIAPRWPRYSMSRTMVSPSPPAPIGDIEGAAGRSGRAGAGGGQGRAGGDQPVVPAAAQVAVHAERGRDYPVDQPGPERRLGQAQRDDRHRSERDGAHDRVALERRHGGVPLELVQPERAAAPVGVRVQQREAQEDGEEAGVVDDHE